VHMSNVELSGRFSEIPSMTEQDGVRRRFADLSAAHPEWAKVAESHKLLQEKANMLYSLPIEEFRKVPYRPAPLAADVPLPGRDLKITQREVAVRDGTNVMIRIYQPIQFGRGRILFFNVHGGGEITRLSMLIASWLILDRLDSRDTGNRGRSKPTDLQAK
jgi:hypothetical protein